MITSRQGRGTFLSESGYIRNIEDKEDGLMIAVDNAIDEALLLGFTLDELLSVVQKRVQERQQLLQEVTIAFIECNREQLELFCPKN